MTDAPAIPELPRRRPPAAPLFAAAMAFGGGILLEHCAYRPARLYFACTLLLALCSLLALLFAARWRARIAYAAAVLAFFPAGGLLATAHGAGPALSTALLRFTDGGEVTLTGYVARSGSLRSSREPRESLDIAVEQVQRENETAQLLSGTVRLSIYVPGSRFASETEEDGADQPAAPPLFDYGQRVRVQAKLRLPTNYRNPGNMDYIAWLREQGVVVLGSAASTNIELLPGTGGSLVERWRWSARRSILQQMEQLWPAPCAGLFQAMILGERGLVERSERTEFQRSGTFHLLVVSGMNVAIFAVFLLWLARRLRLPAECGILAALLLTCGYAWLTELAAPILRSVLMIAACQVAALLNRDRAPLNTVALAALVLLAANPRTLFDASFQLTFLAVLTIAGLVVPLLARTTLPLREAVDGLDDLRRDLMLRPWQAQLRLDIRDWAAFPRRVFGEQRGLWLAARIASIALALAELVMLSVVMQMAITLPTAWYFHRINPRALWANIVVLPLMSLLMPAAMMAVAFSYLARWLAAPFAIFARWSLQGILAAVHGSGGAHLFDLRVPMPSAAAIAAVIAAYTLALLLARRRRWLAAASLALLALAAWTIYALPRSFQHRPNALEITAIDVGQGDSFFIVTPGGRTLLLDSGGIVGSHSDLDIGEDVVSPYLWWRGISRLDAVAFSHSHADHMGGMTAILRNFRPREMWFAPNYPSHELRLLMAAASQTRALSIEHHRGESFNFDGVHFEVLSPPADWELKPRGQDDASMVLRLTYAGHSALLVGDIHKRIEKMLLEDAARRSLLAADLLKVAHHGSNTSSTGEFLDAVHPAQAVISSGIRNPFHHPRPEVLQRLAAHHVSTYRTDLFGPVTFYIDADGVHAAVER